MSYDLEQIDELEELEHGFRWDDVNELLDDLPAGDDLRPAIPALTRDQRELIARLVDGFASRRRFLEWAQDAVVLTLGELGGDWVRARAFTGVDMSVLLTGPDRSVWAPDGDPLKPEAAKRVRMGVASVDVLPACIDAHRHLRWSATEYTNEPGEDGPEERPDPANQRHPAMRPALTELDEKQGWALRALLDGFRSEDAVLAWFQVLNEAAYAEIPGELATRVLVEEPETLELFVTASGDPPEAPFFRESFAAEYLLPAFARAAREVSDRAGEQASDETTTDHSPIRYK